MKLFAISLIGLAFIFALAVFVSAASLVDYKPWDNSNGWNIDPTIQVKINATDATLQLWTNATGSWVKFAESTNLSSGTYMVNTSGLSLFNSYDTDYWYSINISEGDEWINRTIHFHTRHFLATDFPEFFYAVVIDANTVALNWSFEPTIENYVVYRGSEIIYNGTLNETWFYDTNASQGTNYEYRVYGYNSSTDISEGYNREMVTTYMGPNTPTLISPANNSHDLENPITLIWNCTDPYNSTITYDVFFGMSEDNLQLIASNISYTSKSPGPLLYGKKYFWKVRARNEYNGISESPLYNFEMKVFPPQNINCYPLSTEIIRLNWSFGNGSDLVIIRWDNVLHNPWGLSDGELLLETTNLTGYEHTGLEENTTYYYCFWGYSSSINRYSNPVVVYATTSAYGSIDVHTLNAENVTFDRATLKGYLAEDGNYSSIVVYFEYGIGAFDHQTQRQLVSKGQYFSINLTGLNANTTYRFRAVAESLDGLKKDYGEIKEFTTLSYNYIVYIRDEDTGELIDISNHSFTIIAYFSESRYLYTVTENPIGISLPSTPRYLELNIIVNETNYYRSLIPEANQTEYNFYVRIDNVSLLQYYIIGVSDISGRFSGSNTIVTIYTYLNESWEVITQQYLSAELTVNAYLTANRRYEVRLQNNNSIFYSFIYSDSNHQKILTIYPSPGDFKTIENVARISVYYDRENDTIRVFYQEMLSMTNWIRVALFFYNNSTATMEEIFNQTYPSGYLDLTYHINNTNLSYYLEVTINHSAFPENRVLSYNFLPREESSIIDEINNLFTLVFGYNPMGWMNLFVFIILLIMLFTFSPYYGSLGIILSSLFLLFLVVMTGWGIINTVVLVLWLLIAVAYHFVHERGEF